jgi:hypothetical protein
VFIGPAGVRILVADGWPAILATRLSDSAEEELRNIIRPSSWRVQAKAVLTSAPFICFAITVFVVLFGVIGTLAVANKSLKSDIDEAQAALSRFRSDLAASEARANSLFAAFQANVSTTAAVLGAANFSVVGGFSASLVNLSKALDASTERLNSLSSSVALLASAVNGSLAASQSVAQSFASVNASVSGRLDGLGTALARTESAIALVNGSTTAALSAASVAAVAVGAVNASLGNRLDSLGTSTNAAVSAATTATAATAALSGQLAAVNATVSSVQAVAGSLVATVAAVNASFSNRLDSFSGQVTALNTTVYSVAVAFNALPPPIRDGSLVATVAAVNASIQSVAGSLVALGATVAAVNASVSVLPTAINLVNASVASSVGTTVAAIAAVNASSFAVSQAMISLNTSLGLRFSLLESNVSQRIDVLESSALLLSAFVKMKAVGSNFSNASGTTNGKIVTGFVVIDSTAQGASAFNCSSSSIVVRDAGLYLVSARAFVDALDMSYAMVVILDSTGVLRYRDILFSFASAPGSTWGFYGSAVFRLNAGDSAQLWIFNANPHNNLFGNPEAQNTLSAKRIA